MVTRPRAARPVEPKARRKPPIVLIVFALILVIVAAVFVVGSYGAGKRAAETSCAGHLSQLWKMQFIYMSEFGGPMKAMPDRSGEDFWLILGQTKPPLVEADLLRDLLQCPVRGSHDRCDYRGPAERVGRLSDADRVGADKIGAHPKGGNALRKSGDVNELDDAEFGRISRTLRP